MPISADHSIVFSVKYSPCYVTYAVLRYRPSPMCCRLDNTVNNNIAEHSEEFHWLLNNWTDRELLWMREDTESYTVVTVHQVGGIKPKAAVCNRNTVSQWSSCSNMPDAQLVSLCEKWELIPTCELVLNPIVSSWWVFTAESHHGMQPSARAAHPVV